MTESDTETFTGQIQQALGYLQVGDLTSGQQLYQQLAALEPVQADQQLQLARLATNLGEGNFALQHLQRVIDQQPTDSETLVALARALGEINQHELAIKMAQQAVALDAQDSDARTALGALLAETGNSVDAQRHFETMIDDEINLRMAFTNLARLKKFSSADKDLIERAENLLQQELPDRELLAIEFALGKIYDDCENYEQAFRHFQRANQLQAEPYDDINDRAWFDQIREVFSATNIARLSDQGHHSAQPVFIVGMPRSGTTLMERIISSHSRGAGAGELLAIPRIAHTVMRENENKAAARALKRMSAANFESFQSRYLQALRLGQGDASRIVDKLPGNYQNLGLIHSLFPNATIIHAVRHPLDTCLSCYFQAFAEVRWSNSLDTIASTYRLYRDYMAYWSNVLPSGKILEVNYERLVQEPVTEGQRMLEHCGLKWEAESLEFHRKQAVVKTVSHAQVRQPIYQTSTMRWTKYSRHCQQLADSLSDFLQDDRALLADHGITVKKKKLFGLF